MAKKTKKTKKKSGTVCVFEFFGSIEQAAIHGPMPYDRTKAFLPYCVKTADGQALTSLEVSLDKHTHEVDEAGMKKMRDVAHDINFAGFVKSMRIEDYKEENH